VSNQVEGRCLCGAVRFFARGEPAELSWRHCQSCRRHTGAPASAFVAFKRDAYVVTEGEITKFNSSPGRLRGFCARCGSTMKCEGKGLPEIQFHRHVYLRRRLSAQTDKAVLSRGTLAVGPPDRRCASPSVLADSTREKAENSEGQFVVRPIPALSPAFHGRRRDQEQYYDVRCGDSLRFLEAVRSTCAKPESSAFVCF
jgi:hypothetical protein